MPPTPRQETTSYEPNLAPGAAPMERPIIPTRRAAVGRFEPPNRVFLREMRTAQILLLTTCVAISSLSAAGGLKVGDFAPQFSLPGSDGKSYDLATYKGKQVVVLAWFAKAFTGG